MSDIANVFKAPKALPEASKVMTMPDMEDPIVKAAGKKKREEEAARGGRDSTNLTGAQTTYGNTTLGA